MMTAPLRISPKKQCFQRKQTKIRPQRDSKQNRKLTAQIWASASNRHQQNAQLKTSNQT